MKFENPDIDEDINMLSAGDYTLNVVDLIIGSYCIIYQLLNKINYHLGNNIHTTNLILLFFII